MVIKEISYDSFLYELSRKFREEVLRKPLGVTLDKSDVEGEDRQIHIVVLEEDEICGTVVLKPLSADRVKLRQMAVAASQRGQGTGRALIETAEDIARAKKFLVIEMSARISAQGFYKKLGYHTVGKEYVREITGSHIAMEKEL